METRRYWPFEDDEGRINRVDDGTPSQHPGKSGEFSFVFNFCLEGIKTLQLSNIGNHKLNIKGK